MHTIVNPWATSHLFEYTYISFSHVSSTFSFQHPDPRRQRQVAIKNPGPNLQRSRAPRPTLHAEQPDHGRRRRKEPDAFWGSPSTASRDQRGHHQEELLRQQRQVRHGHGSQQPPFGRWRRGRGRSFRQRRHPASSCQDQVFIEPSQPRQPEEHTVHDQELPGRIPQQVRKRILALCFYLSLCICLKPVVVYVVCK